MARVAPFRSGVARNVHRVRSNCTVGDTIQRENRVSGTGGLPMCKRRTDPLNDDKELSSLDSMIR